MQRNRTALAHANLQWEHHYSSPNISQIIRIHSMEDDLYGIRLCCIAIAGMKRDGASAGTRMLYIAALSANEKDGKYIKGMFMVWSQDQVTNTEVLHWPDDNSTACRWSFSTGGRVPARHAVRTEGDGDARGGCSIDG